MDSDDHWQPMFLRVESGDEPENQNNLIIAMRMARHQYPEFHSRQAQEASIRGDKRKRRVVPFAASTGGEHSALPVAGAIADVEGGWAA